MKAIEPLHHAPAMGPKRQVRLGIGQRLLSHVEACRPDLLAYAGLVGLAGALLASPDAPAWRLIGAWLAPTLGWIAAMYGGDYFDRELDAISKPYRPIPSGRISARTAFRCFVASVTLGGIVAVVLNPLNALVVVATLGLGVSYSRYLKARGAWGNLVRGGVTAMAFLMGTLSTSTVPPAGLLLFGLVFWLHDSGSNVVGTICDREGDRAGGYLTVPVRHGDTVALWLMLAFDVCWFAVAALAPLAMGEEFDRLNYWAFLSVVASMAVLSALMLFRAPRPIPREGAVRAHQVIVLERLVLVCALVAAATGVALGLALLVPSALLTMLTSRVMSRRADEVARESVQRETT